MFDWTRSEFKIGDNFAHLLLDLAAVIALRFDEEMEVSRCWLLEWIGVVKSGEIRKGGKRWSNSSGGWCCGGISRGEGTVTAELVVVIKESRFKVSRFWSTFSTCGCCCCFLRLLVKQPLTTACRSQSTSTSIFGLIKSDRSRAERGRGERERGRRWL